MKRTSSIVLVALLAACGGPQLSPTATPVNTAFTKTLSKKAHSGALVYVSTSVGSTGTVDVYPSKGQGQPPIETITDGISAPQGLAVDSAGNLYVANAGNNTVTVYPPSQTTPSVTYSSGVSAPYGVVVGTDGTVYIANTTGGGSGTGSVTEYPAGSTTPNLTIELPNKYAYDVALDASNHLYVSWFSLSSLAVQIYEYQTEGSSSGQNLDLDLPTHVFPAYAIAFDPSGNLIVPVEPLTHNPPKYLAVFPPGATKPKHKINCASLLDVVTGIAFLPGKPKLMYVSAANDHDWLEVTYPKLVPRDVVNVTGPGGLALSP